MLDLLAHGHKTESCLSQNFLLLIYSFIYLSCKSKYTDIGYVNLYYILSKYNNDYDIIPLEI
jgi:hypothetical protein